MNLYAKKLMTYQLVHRLHHQDFSISYTSKQCELDWRSVKKYLAMSEAQFVAFLQTQLERKRELQPCHTIKPQKAALPKQGFSAIFKQQFTI